MSSESTAQHAHLDLAASRTALVLIDLQKGIIAAPRQPRSAGDAVAACAALAARFRAARAQVVLVHVGFAPDYGDALKQPVDEPSPRPDGGLPPDFTTFADGLQQDGDIVILKRNWGAFHGTELDVILSRRGINTIVVAGITTNFGVESTARQAWERNYAVVVAEDGCTTNSAEMHGLAVKYVLPRIARVRQSGDIRLV